MTNATRAQVVCALNAMLALVTSFGVQVSGTQQAALVGAMNALLSVWVSLTYKASRKRIRE